jgi:hypothetical protein
VHIQVFLRNCTRTEANPSVRSATLIGGTVKKRQFSLGMRRRDHALLVAIGSLPPRFGLVFIVWHGAVSTDVPLCEARSRSASGDISRTEAPFLAPNWQQLMIQNQQSERKDAPPYLYLD